MELVISSIVLIAIFIAIARAEFKSSRRTKDSNARTDEKISELAAHTQARYKAKFGKDPTLELPLHNPEEKP